MPWVKLLWAAERRESPQIAPHRERVLPTGSMHLVLRLSEAPLVLFESAAGRPSQTLGPLIMGGARSGYYIKQVTSGAGSVGAQLQPGGAPAMFGVPASELAEQHVPLDALWGLDAALLRERLQEVSQVRRATAPQNGALDVLRAQVDLLESALLRRLRKGAPDAQPRLWLASTLAALDRGTSLATVVDQSAVSHRAFIARFRSMVGLTPKTFARIRRFQRVVEALSAEPQASLSRLAFEAGYSDQAHLTRDFAEFAGVSPTAYSRLAPSSPNHVRIET